MTNSKKLSLPSSADELPGFIEAIMNDFILPYNFPETTAFSIKWILTELSTNTYKHAIAEKTELIVTIDASTISIIKTDKGNPPPFYLLSKQVNGQKINIYACSSNPLFAEKRKGGLLYFHEELITVETIDIESFCEHFGLLIVTRSSNEFTFFRDEKEQANIFKAVINY